MLGMRGRLPRNLSRAIETAQSRMNNRQSIDRFKSILVAAGVKSLAPKPEEGVSPTAPAAIAEAEEIKDEIKRITNDASLQIDVAVSSLSEDKRVDTENTYTDAISKVAQKVLADIVDTTRLRSFMA